MSWRTVASMVLLMASYAVLGFIAIYSAFVHYEGSLVVVLVCAIALSILTASSIRRAGDTDYLQARQSDRTLDLASKTLPFMSQGLDLESAQNVCDILFPAVAANAVAITDREKILGFTGVDRENHVPGSLIQTDSTRETLEDGQTRIVSTAREVGFERGANVLRAGVITPLVVDKHIVGTLKFYFKAPSRLNETQRAMAEGFAQLLSTQLSLSYLQQQTELAARMELRALQAQINPHFLFNTINTIASTVRTDPDKARVMLREFAVYYRRLLENSEDFISISKEVEQTERYLMFQQARFGEDAISIQIDIEPGLENLEVPSFIMQPIVENSVGHGRREEGALHIKVKVYHASDSVIISIADDGIGIAPERLDTLVDGGSKTGMGIALKNVNARLKAAFGTISGLYIDSTLGEGTTVYLSLYDALVSQRERDAQADENVIVDGPLPDEALPPGFPSEPQVHYSPAEG